MKLKQQALTIAIILMSLGLFLGGFYVVHADDEQPTTETQEVTEEEKEKEQGGDTKTIEETKQKVEEINTKIDKVDNQIAQQMIDKETLKEQAGDIEALKEDLTEVKATLKSIQVPDVPTKNGAGNPYEADKLLPLNKRLPYYIYHLRVNNQDYVIVSNSDRLTTGYAMTPNGKSYKCVVLGLYTENNGELKQPIVGIRYAENSDTYLSLNDAKALLLDPDNWGYFPTNQPTTGINYKNYMGFFKRNSEERVTRYMLGPAGIAVNPEEYYETENGYFTGIANLQGENLNSNGSGGGTGQGYTYYAIPTDSQYYIELIETIEPIFQDWTTEQLYMPVLIIMSVLVIMLFKKR